MLSIAAVFVAAAATCWLSLMTAEASSYNIAEDPPRIIQSIASDLLFDENNRLSKHTLVYDATNPTCQDTIRNQLQDHFRNSPYDAERFDMAGVEGDALDRVFGPYRWAGNEAEADTEADTEANRDDICMAACIERGVERDMAAYVMPERVFSSGADHDHDADSLSVTKWFSKACTRVEICLLSYHSRDHPLQVYWERRNGVLRHHLSLEYGDKHTRCFQSFLGHHFVARDESDPEHPFDVGELTVEHITVKGWGESPPSDIRSPAHNFVAEIERTLENEWTRHNRIQRTFSPLGFKKGRLPNDVFASLGAFYYNNAMNVVREEWNFKGVFVNWWETDVLFLQIPWDMKQLYQVRLRSMVEEWAGEPVEQTVMYGLRQYTEGARLLTHVDRHSTHAVSLIVNVAQGNLTEPWPVEVQDHADRLHEVLMDPGDVIYYESAKCLHARNRPMMGPNAYYVNMFTHYRPLNDPNWFQKPNPEGAPEPVLGGKPVSEECKLVNKGIAATGVTGHSVGLLQGVECDNPDLGPYVSPSLFQANGPNDLIAWWRATSPLSQQDTPEVVAEPNFTAEPDVVAEPAEAEADVVGEPFGTEPEGAVEPDLDRANIQGEL